MRLQQFDRDVLSTTSAMWFQRFAGISALDVARELSVDHSKVLKAFERLVAAAQGTINADVELTQIIFDPDKISTGFSYEPVVSHIFFPSESALRAAFFASEISRQDIPEYTKRLYLGASQIQLFYFNEEVLSRYFDHPELYEVDDSLSGGDIKTVSSAPEDRYLYVRHGKVRLQSGNVAVTVICKDLSSMAKVDQRHWHSHELDSGALDTSDAHFKKFLARTYEGAFVDYEDPIARLTEAAEAVNRAIRPLVLFPRTGNPHLCLPVDQTYKTYCDAASELYKLVGPDNLTQQTLRQLLGDRFGVSNEELVHESGRALSTKQMLVLLEQKLGSPGLLSSPLRDVADLRTAADHRVLLPEAVTQSYSRQFAEMCTRIAEGLERLATLLAQA